MFAKTPTAAYVRSREMIPFQIPKSKSAEAFSKRQTAKEFYLLKEPAFTFSAFGCALGELNPDHYQESANETTEAIATHDAKGKLSFTLHYHSCVQKLKVVIHAVHNLEGHSKTGELLSCFLRVGLMPSTGKFFQTKSKKKVRDAMFEETFHFQIARDKMADHELKVQLHQYRGSKSRSKQTGEITIALNETTATESRRCEEFL